MYNLMWKVGGISLFLLQMTKALALDPRFEIYLLCEKMPAQFRSQIQEPDLNIVETGFSGTSSGGTFKAGINWILLPTNFVKKVAKIISKIDPDILNPHDFPDVLYATHYKAHIKSDAKVCWFCHEPFRPFYDSTTLRQPVHERVFFTAYRRLFSRTDINYIRSLVDSVGANSKCTAKSIRKIYGRNARVIYPGIDVNRFRPVASDVKNNLKCDSLILSVGTIDFSVKNLGIIPTVLSKIGTKYNLKWVHVGDGRDKLRLLNLAKSYRVSEYLKIIEYASEDELISYYSAANVVVYPSIQEPFGLVPLEAMACETPVVTSKFGGPSETVVHGKTGLLVDTTSVGEIALAVSYLLDNETVARNMGISGCKRVSEHFTLEKTAKDFTSLIGST